MTFSNGDPVSFVILERDAAELHLTLDAAHTPSGSNVCHLMVDNAAGIFDVLRDDGVTIVKPLRDAEYGLRGFVVADPDGNRLDFGQVL